MFSWMGWGGPRVGGGGAGWWRWSNIYRKTINHISNTNRTTLKHLTSPIEQLSIIYQINCRTICRASIEIRSNLWRASTEHLSDNVYRGYIKNWIELLSNNLSKLYATSVEQPSNSISRIHRRSIEDLSGSWYIRWTSLLRRVAADRTTIEHQ